MTHQEAFHKIIRKFNLSNNSLILIKEGSRLANTDSIKGIADACKAVGLTGIVIAVVADFRDLTVLSERDMKRHGWIRFSSAVERIARSNDDDHQDIDDHQLDSDDSSGAEPDTEQSEADQA